MIRDTFKQIIIVSITLVLSIYITKAFQQKEVVVVGEPICRQNVLEFAIRCEQAKFNRFGFSVDFEKDINQCKVKTNIAPFTIPDSCFIIDKGKLYFEISKSSAFVYGQEISFTIEFDDTLTVIPKNGFKMAMHGDLLFSSPYIVLFQKKSNFHWLGEVKPREAIFLGSSLYLAIAACMLFLRRKQEHKLIKEYSENLDKPGMGGTWFIDFLMWTVISPARSSLTRRAEFLLDFLIDKRTFIRTHIDSLPKIGISGKLLPNIANESLYIRLRNDSIREMIIESRLSRLKAIFKPNTIGDLRKRMISLI